MYGAQIICNDALTPFRTPPLPTFHQYANFKKIYGGQSGGAICVVFTARFGVYLFRTPCGWLLILPRNPWPISPGETRLRLL